MNSQVNRTLPEASGIGGNAMAIVPRISLILDCVLLTHAELVALVVGTTIQMEVALKTQTIRHYYI